MSIRLVRTRDWRWMMRLELALGVGLVALSGCYVPRPRGATGPNADAIEAANSVDLESERLPLLKDIARRRNLTQAEQIYLVDSICHAGFGGEQGPAMIALLENPCCTEMTRKHVAKKLRFIMFSDQRRSVAEVLIKRTAQPAEASAAQREDEPPAEPNP